MSSQADVVIVCDGAYREDMLIGGCGGHITVITDSGPPVSKTFSRPALGHKDSTQVELTAAAFSMQVASNMLRDMGLAASSVTIHTDSQSGMNILRKFNSENANPKYTKYAQAITSAEGVLFPDDDSKVQFKYVRAHVAMHKATPIERLHNEVDKVAVEAKETAIRAFLNPLPDKKTVGVALPARPKEVDAGMLFGLGEALGEQGYQIRMVLDGAVRKDKYHPFTRGFEKGLSTIGLQLLDRLYDATDYRPVNVIRISKNELTGLPGMLFSMEQRRRLDIKAKNVNSTSIVASLAGEAAGLWYGGNSIDRGPTDTALPNSSESVIDLTGERVNEHEPRNLSSWIQATGDLRYRSKLPVYRDLDAALSAMPDVVIKQANDPVSSLMSEIKEYVNAYHDELTKEQLGHGIQAICAEQGLNAPDISIQHVIKGTTPDVVAKRAMEMGARIYQYQITEKADKPGDTTNEPVSTSVKLGR